MFREVMQHAGLEIFAEVGVLFFFGSFLMILALAMFGMSSAERHQALNLPLQEDDHA